MIFEQVKIAFLEDKDVFEAQQRIIDTDTSESQVDIHADAGGIQARRILARLHEDENASRQAAE
jgi:vanillate O-demethylase monooxygenase subunit